MESLEKRSHRLQTPYFILGKSAKYTEGPTGVSRAGKALRPAPKWTRDSGSEQTAGWIACSVENPHLIRPQEELQSMTCSTHHHGSGKHARGSLVRPRILARFGGWRFNIVRLVQKVQHPHTGFHCRFKISGNGLMIVGVSNTVCHLLLQTRQDCAGRTRT